MPYADAAPLRRLLLAAALLLATPVGAVSPVLDPSGGSFYDLPFPYELRRDANGTISLAGFPRPSTLIGQYLDAIEETPGFGLSAGIFFKLDGELDPASLPSAADSVTPTSSVFLIDIDPTSTRRGRRIPLWTEFRSVGDAFRDDHLLGMMPVPGHLLDPDTLYGVVLTDALRDDVASPLTAPPFLARMASESPSNEFDQRSLQLFRMLWNQLERHEGLDRTRVVGATIFRTGKPVDGLVAVEKLIRHSGPIRAFNLALDTGRSTGRMWVFTGQFAAPQFQTGMPPFTAAGSGRFVFGPTGRPTPLRSENLHFVLTVPKETSDASIAMPRAGWPAVAYMHGTGGSRFSMYSSGKAARLAEVGIASLAIDQPLHGLRAGATPDGANFYNPLNPFALRDNPRQAAADSLVVHHLLRTLRVDPELITLPPGAGFVETQRTIRFDRRRRLYMGHSQGATTGPLFLGVARNVPGGVLSAGGGHLLVNILTREEPFFAGLKLRDLAAILLGGPVDLFHPGLHLLQMGSEVSDPMIFAPRFREGNGGRPQSLLFTHGLLDGFVTTPMTTAMVVAAGYPLVAPTFPAPAFPLLPGYLYQEAFDLAGLPTLTPPVMGNLAFRSRVGTGGLVHYENEGHFPVFNNPDAIAQWTEFLRTLAYEDQATIPAR